MVPKNPKPFVFYTKGIEYKSFYDPELKAKRYFLKGHVDSEDLDLVKDIVTKDCMADVSTQFKARSIKLDFDHETLRKNKDENDFTAKLNLTKIPLGKAIEEEQDEKGNLVNFELNANYKKFDSKGDIVMTFKEIWANVKSGFYDYFSIAYIPTKTTIKYKGSTKIRLLDRINLLNVALTGNPINPHATISKVMAKSLDWMKNQEVNKISDKKEQKSYEKDGAHAHTESEPLGLHNHPEIELRLRSEVEWLEGSISRLHDRINELERPVSTNEVGNTMKSKQAKSGEIMTDTNKPPEGTQEKPADAGSQTPSEQSTPASTTESAEGKGFDAKAFGEMKSQIETLAKSVEGINAILAKALPAGHGTPNAAAKSAEANAQVASGPEIKGTMDLL